MRASLHVVHEKANVKQVQLLAETIIGRSPDCNLKIASSQVSRRHCKLTVEPDGVFAEDLGSANGTLVNGHLIPPNQCFQLESGYRLLIGPAEFILEIEGQPAMVAVEPTEAAPAANAHDTVESPAEALNDVAPAFEPEVDQTIMQEFPSQEDSAEETTEFDPEAGVQTLMDIAEAVSTAEPMGEFGGEPVADDEQTLMMESPLQPATENFTEFVADEFPVETPAISEGDPAPTSEAASSKKSAGGLKSLFGLFGKKETPVAAPTSSAKTAPAKKGKAKPADPAAAVPTIAPPAFASDEDLAFAALSDEGAGAAPPHSIDEDDDLAKFLGNME